MKHEKPVQEDEKDRLIRILEERAMLAEARTSSLNPVGLAIISIFFFTLGALLF
ncbi:hypothetical protein [Pontivivens ytuae]|uniref:Uncharacterized protein n=1 Tax=Pontivivens ytuae TaxID=2789856 RepID=A0A7S9QBV6_9RHOB|nr:hypothetical protein [Pontivivens ytuae]QPH52747.1 hypothetical protein I0K15_13110 [Pontivivens ytuae]